MELLSVCVCQYDRVAVPHRGKVLRIFPRCVESLRAALAGASQEGELVVAHWPAPGDPSPPEDWLPSAAGIPARVLRQAGPFSRGAGRNAAARAAAGEWLLFLDADMLVSAAVVRRGVEVLRAGLAFFPLYRRYTGPEEGAWTPGTGTGNAFVAREYFERSGGFPERPQWGGEDTAFARWFDERGLLVREDVPDFCHQWHPKGEARRGY